MAGCVKLKWKWSFGGQGYWETKVDWQDAVGKMTCYITIEPRPVYCGRGQWIAKTNAPLDDEEGWPRYYFDLDTAKKEIQKWVNKREEIK